MLLVECGKELGVMVRVDAVDAPILAKVDNVYKQWTMEEAKAHVSAEQDVQMGDENMQETRGQGASIAVPAVTEKMLHIEVVSQPVWKQLQQTIAESKDKTEPKGHDPAQVNSAQGTLHVVLGEEGSMYWSRKRAQTGTSVVQASKTTKASLSKRIVDNKVEVVESHTCVKGKSLRLLCAKAMESHAAYLQLQVHVDQLTKALEKIGVE
ncbi:hypothetical protein M404DRAFT_31674 [Pisolithus tinctorius Marx 270]|uniref:Uncharacterized protein n=1 Tax=Pisolithus tinctorius Marx 270 TaxID=870435 RepID=A0A0C3NA49_PISTI|nr:hypothetical protein M404DRAFT_31674 [Pisolithus tinctorius Marx 270]